MLLVVIVIIVIKILQHLYIYECEDLHIVNKYFNNILNNPVVYIHNTLELSAKRILYMYNHKNSNISKYIKCNKEWVAFGSLCDDTRFVD